MKIFLILAGLVSAHYGISQTVSLKITTDVYVDSVYFSDKSLDVVRLNDTLIQVELGFSNTTENQNLALYSKKRIYKTELSIEDIKDKLSDAFQNRANISMTKKACTVLTIDGYSMHLIGSLQVYSVKPEKLLIKESCGIYIL